MQLGFIARTPRGRILLKKGYEHLGLKMPEAKMQQLSLLERED